MTHSLLSWPLARAIWPRQPRMAKAMAQALGGRLGAAPAEATCPKPEHPARPWSRARIGQAMLHPAGESSAQRLNSHASRYVRLIPSSIEVADNFSAAAIALSRSAGPARAEYINR